MVRDKNLRAALINRCRFYRLRAADQLAFLCSGGSFRKDASLRLLTPRLCRLLPVAKQRAVWRNIARRIPQSIQHASSMRFVRCKEQGGVVRVAFVAIDGLSAIDPTSNVVGNAVLAVVEIKSSFCN